MKKTIIELPMINLIGISSEANNTDKVDNIMSTWNRYTSCKICNSMPQKIYAIYTNYESDFHGDYTFFIGKEVTSLDNIESNLLSLQIVPQNYIKFTNEENETVIDMWKNIWQMEEDKTLGGERSYIADFEIYNPENNGAVDIYIGIIK